MCSLIVFGSIIEGTKPCMRLGGHSYRPDKVSVGIEINASHPVPVGRFKQKRLLQTHLMQLRQYVFEDVLFDHGWPIEVRQTPGQMFALTSAASSSAAGPVKRLVSGPTSASFPRSRVAALRKEYSVD